MNETIKEELRIAEKRTISLEGEHSTHFHKYERETANFRFLLQRYKDEKESLEKSSEAQKEII
jgi:hypothetical protein